MTAAIRACIAREGARLCGAPCAVGAVFCTTHLRAPAVKRGGWISAYKRKLAMAPSPLGTQHPQIVDVYDASNVYPKLWVGAAPPVDRSYPSVDMIVLCAKEYQPPAFPHFPGALIRVAIRDDVLEEDELRRALVGGTAVAKALAGGKRVLVTCAAGINRSALVASLGLLHVTKNAPGGRAMTVDQVIALMKAKRHPDCLYNKHFQDVLRKYGATAG